MLRMLTQLFQKMGMPVKTDQLPRLKQEVRIAVLRYDTDCNGTLEFDEVSTLAGSWLQHLRELKCRSEEVSLQLLSGWLVVVACRFHRGVVSIMLACFSG